MERVRFPSPERVRISHTEGTTAHRSSVEGPASCISAASAPPSLDCSSSGLHNIFLGCSTPLLTACLDGASHPGISPFAWQQSCTSTTAVAKVAASSPFFKARAASPLKERQAKSTAASSPQRHVPVRSHSVSGCSVKAQFAAMLKAEEMAGTEGLAQGQGKAERKATPRRLRPSPSDGTSPRSRQQPMEKHASATEAVSSPRTMHTIMEEPAAESEAELLPTGGVSLHNQPPRAGVSPDVQPPLHTTSSRPVSQPATPRSGPSKGCGPQGCLSSASSAQGSPRTPRRMLSGKTVRADVNVADELAKLMAPGRMAGVARSLSQRLEKICKRWF